MEPVAAFRGQNTFLGPGSVDARSRGGTVGWGTKPSITPQWSASSSARSPAVALGLILQEMQGAKHC